VSEREVGSISIPSLEQDLQNLGVAPGDTIMARANLGAVGSRDRKALLQAMLNAVGADGTIISLAFTATARPWNVNKFPVFDRTTPSYAGALANTMLRFPGSFRSGHPQCSYVAIGRKAEQFMGEHGPDSGAYEPVRKLFARKGKMLLVGCVESSPGFTTTHLAEVDSGLSRRVIAPWLHKRRYIAPDGATRMFTRKDMGLCSTSFRKFYELYEREGLLRRGYVGQAYSIVGDAEACYRLDRAVLESNPHFNLCGSLDCMRCNLRRWDRIHMWPVFGIRRLLGLHKRAQHADAMPM
jgi:aminoglycoside N3'-acetyltransferase